MTNGNSRPSGIAQLRKTSDLNLGQQVDPMNLDDFIFPENAPSTTMPPSAQNLAMMRRRQQKQQQNGDASAHTTAAAIPIKSRKHASSQPSIPQSVPVAHPRHQNEFGYVTRHHRKTSIDDRRVSPFFFLRVNRRQMASRLSLHVSYTYIYSSPLSMAFKPDKKVCHFNLDAPYLHM